MVRPTHSKRTLAVLLLLALSICAVLPRIVVDQVIAPRADFSRNGWQMHFYQPAGDVGSSGYTSFVPGGEPIALNPDFQRTTGYIIWKVPVDGRYIFKLVANEAATLSVDGRRVMTLGDHGPAFERMDEWVSLSEGPHLFQVQLRNDRGEGGFSVGMMIPPTMHNRLLMGSDVAAPQAKGLAFWWLLLRLSRMGVAAFGTAAALMALAALLPLSLSPRFRLALPATAAIALLPALLIPAQPQREPYIGEMVHQKLEEKNPDFVFIGNSMLDSRIDDDHLEHLLEGKKVYSIVNFGGLAAIHYLSFKYLLLPADVHPKKVFILFRGNQFHQPRKRTSDPLVVKTIERLTPGPDPLFERLVHGRSRSFSERVHDLLLGLFPVVHLQERARAFISNAAVKAARTLTGDRTHNVSSQSFLAEINRRFAFGEGNLRAGTDGESINAAASAESLDFYGSLDNSFLPQMIDLARKKGLTLVFVRVQERPTTQGPREDSPALKQYMADFRRYLADNGMYLYDFSGDPELPLSAYRDGDHIADAQKYTELFVRRLGNLLQ